MRSVALPFSTRYREAVAFALRRQVPCVLLALLMLDGGRAARVCGVALLGSWAGVALVMARRPGEPGAADLAFVRWGFWPALALTAALAARIA